MADVNSILTRLISSLTVSDPTWDVSVGSATYKILESVANEIATATNNSTLQTYSFNVNSKAGTTLDAFVNLFGISRQLGKRSTGTVIFSLASPSTVTINIPTGTQMYAPGTNTTNGANVYFSTSSPGVIAIGQTQIEIPVVSTLVGSNGNVGPGAITTVTSTILGSPSVTNYKSLTGGTDTETDNQLQNRWTNTAFSNISGTKDKFIAMALQNPDATQVNVVGAQQIAQEQLQVITVISGNSTGFKVGLNAQAQLSVVSGAKVATLLYGSLPAYNTITSGFIVASVSGIFPVASGGSIFYDGTNYQLSSTNTTWSGSTVSGTLFVNYTTYGTTTLSGGTTSSGVVTSVSGILASLGFNSNIFVLGSGVAVASGVQIWTSQSTGYNVIASGTTVSGINYITSQIPDSKYAYPQGSEIVGTNLNTSTQIIYSNNVDYFYPISPTVPLTIPLNPTINNAPNTYTGALLQLQSEYIPISSRIVNPTINSNIVDVFVNSTNSYTVTEQVIFNPSTLFTATSGQLSSSNFVFSNGSTCASGINANQGDYYIPLSQKPLVNFPAQIVSGNAPSIVTFGAYSLPLCLEYVNNSSGGFAPTLLMSGSAGSNILTTSASVSGICTGLVVSGNNISNLPFGTYITAITPGNPNQVQISTTLSGNYTGNVSWVSIAYPVYDATGTAGSPLDLSGIAIDSFNYAGYPGPPFNGGTSPAQATAMVGTFTHAYNTDVSQINDITQQSRVIGTDVLVHQAQSLNLLVNLSLVYQNGVNINTVNSAISTALTTYFNNLSYNSVISFSAIASVVLNVSGVSGARITTSVDNPNAYGIQAVAIDGTILKTYTTNVLLANNQLPSLYKINTIGYGVNNF